MIQEQGRAFVSCLFCCLIRHSRMNCCDRQSMATKKTPHPVYADPEGNIYDEPGLLMLVRRGGEMSLPRPDEMIPLPETSDLFLLPGRNAAGLDPGTGNVEMIQGLALAGFASPGHTLSGTAAFVPEDNPPRLPLFAYGAVGFMGGRFWITATRVDQDQRQNFTCIPQSRITRRARELLHKYPQNRLMRHLAGCALNYCCPAARNLALGRFEAPLPVARACNAACIGCISLQPPDSGMPATQNRIDFNPSPREILEVMLEHCSRENRAILSFGQGCEGEPLTRAETIISAVKKGRQSVPGATININTNASLPEHVEELAGAGVDSIRVSLNSADQDFYREYFRPRNYSMENVRQSIAQARENSLFISLNLLFFPGATDTEYELDKLIDLVQAHKVDFIQMRNLNLDPDIYWDLARNRSLGPQVGLKNYMRRIRKECPWIGFGYFNPWLQKS